MEIKRNGSQPSSQEHETNIAIQEYLDGNAADWMEKVSDEQDQG